MRSPRNVILPFVLVGGAILLGGWFLQEGVSREESAFLQSRLLQEVVDYVSSEYVDEVDDQRLYDAAIRGILRELEDPNTSFIDATAWEDFRIRATDGGYAGVGLEVTERDGLVTVLSPIPGGPGDRAGIRPGDRFLSIDGRDARTLGVDAAVDILRGDEGTTVRVEMSRMGVANPIPFTLTREVIQLKAVPYAMLLEDGVGYVPLQAFRSTSTTEVETEIRRLLEEGADGIILDVRGNLGGLLDEGISISELFLGPDLTVVETRGRGAGQSATYSTRGEAEFPDVPLVVLLDESSASASEIVAGALQDHDRALLIGAPSFGKGSVQTLFRLSGGNVLRLTTAYWYTPAGRSIQKTVPEDPDLRPRGAWTLSNGVVATEDLPGRPEFQSAGGRTVLGGGGITPDLWVIQDTLTTVESEAVQELFSQAGTFNQTLFNFAAKWIQDQGPIEPGFRVSGAAVQAFREALAEQGLSPDPQVFRDADRYIRFQLESEIALQALGEEGRFRRIRDRDRQLQAAVEALSQGTTARALVALGDSRAGAGAAGINPAGD
jgi:carboxyl-terminal processing protease